MSTPNIDLSQLQPTMPNLPAPTPAMPTYTGSAYAAPAGSPAAQAATAPPSPDAPPNISALFGGNQQPQQAPLTSTVSDPQEEVKQQTLQLAPQIYQSHMPTGKGLKGMLQRFAYGFGQSAMHEAGLATDPELQAQAVQQAHIQAQTQLVQQQIQQAKTMVPVTLPNGTTTMLPMALAQKMYAAQTAAKSREAVAGVNADSRETVANINAQSKAGLPIPLDANTAKLLNLDPSLIGKPLTTSQWGSVQKALTSQGLKVQDLGNDGVWALDKQGNKIHQISAASPSVDRAKAFASARAQNTAFSTFDSDGNLVTTSAANAIASGAPDATKYQSLYGPTSSTKTQGQAAGAVAGHIPEFQQAVKNLEAKGQLGPVMGRLNQYLSQGYGGNDPDIANFMTFISLIKSGAVRAHFGAKGGAQVLNSFDKTLNPAMGPEALIGSTNALNTWLKTYGDVGTLKGPKTNISAGGAGSKPAGSKPLDKATAQQYFEKAGGNPARARALAKADGYTF